MPGRLTAPLTVAQFSAAVSGECGRCSRSDRWRSTPSAYWLRRRSVAVTAPGGRCTTAASAASRSTSPASSSMLERQLEGRSSQGRRCPAGSCSQSSTGAPGEETRCRVALRRSAGRREASPAVYEELQQLAAVYIGLAPEAVKL